MEFISITGDVEFTINSLKQLNIENELFNLGVSELEQVAKNIKVFGVPQENYKIDLTIARGLDYYTGTVYETFLDEYKSIGSVCSGGRYNDLAGFYTDKQLPGVGMSIGLTRLFFVLDDLGLIKTNKNAISDILIISMVEDLKPSIEVANQLRKSGINTEIYFDNKKIKAKFKYADKLKIPYVIVIGEDEINSGKLTLKNMETGEQEQKTVEEIIEFIRQGE